MQHKRDLHRRSPVACTSCRAHLLQSIAKAAAAPAAQTSHARQRTLVRQSGRWHSSHQSPRRSPAGVCTAASTCTCACHRLQQGGTGGGACAGSTAGGSGLRRTRGSGERRLPVGPRTGHRLVRCVLLPDLPQLLVHALPLRLLGAAVAYVLDVGLQRAMGGDRRVGGRRRAAGRPQLRGPAPGGRAATLRRAQSREALPRSPSGLLYC